MRSLTSRAAGPVRLGVAGAATALVVAGAVLPLPASAVPTASTSAASVDAASAPAAAVPDRTRTKRWTTNKQFRTGHRKGVIVRGGSVRIADRPAGTKRYDDPYRSGEARTFDFGRWTSAWVDAPGSATTLIPSWNVRAPQGTFVRVLVRTKSGSQRSSWDLVANWAHGTRGAVRHSGDSQADDLNRLLTDTLVSNGTSHIDTWQLRITLMRPHGSTKTPVLDSAGAAVSTYRTRSQRTSRTTMDRKVRLRGVPRYSQMVHDGHFPQWGGGGTVWCSPTSTAMVLDHYGLGPSPRQYRWTGEADGQVDHGARYTYDHAYEGTGNWPFNTAYAGRQGADAFVTRLYNLRDVEQFIKAGIPVVISIAFDAGELDNSPLMSTNGHLLVVAGFRANGRVIVNDPAASSNAGVRRTYDRGQLERAWLGGSGGVAYVIRPADRPLPPNTPRW